MASDRMETPGIYSRQPFCVLKSPIRVVGGLFYQLTMTTFLIP